MFFGHDCGLLFYDFVVGLCGSCGLTVCLEQLHGQVIGLVASGKPDLHQLCFMLDEIYSQAEMTYLFVLVVLPEAFLACLVIEDKVGRDHVLASLIHLLLKAVQFIAILHLCDLLRACFALSTMRG